jgi:vancomycin resistance protein VanJ
MIRLFWLLVRLYGAIITAMLSMRLVVGERSPLVGLFNTVSNVALLPALIFFPLALLFRKRSTAIMMLPALEAFYRAYGWVLRTKRIPAAKGEEFSLLTFNTHADATDSIMQVIRDANADVVALQELSEEAAKRFENEFADRYPYRALFPDAMNTTGQGVLSRFPIRESSYWQYDVSPRCDELGHERVEIDLNGTELVVYNVHPMHPGMGHGFYDDRPRYEEITDILERIGKETGAVILCGDHNMTEHNDDYKRITATLADSFREAGHGFGLTWADMGWGNPLFLRLDYVFHNSALMARNAVVWHTSGGSDHRPVLVRLALR